MIAYQDKTACLVYKEEIKSVFKCKNFVHSSFREKSFYMVENRKSFSVLFCLYVAREFYLFLAQSEKAK